MTRILITGGSGFLGKHLIQRLSEKKGNFITAVARNESSLSKLKRKFPTVKIICGDIANEMIAKKSCRGQDKIYHLAAFKHATLAEKNTYQCIQSNIFGTLNLLQEFKGKLFFAMSTDKACDPSFVYGSTKFLMEKLLEEFQEINPFTAYRTIRCGNILYSTGSVLCIWKNALEKGEKIIITDPDATRYFWSADQVINYMFDVEKNCNTCKPQSAKMKAVRMMDLLEAMQIKYGMAQGLKVIGLQEGENKHEKLTKDGESSEVAEKYSIDEMVEML